MTRLAFLLVALVASWSGPCSSSARSCDPFRRPMIFVQPGGWSQPQFSPQFVFSSQQQFPGAWSGPGYQPAVTLPQYIPSWQPQFQGGQTFSTGLPSWGGFPGQFQGSQQFSSGFPGQFGGFPVQGWQPQFQGSQQFSSGFPGQWQGGQLGGAPGGL